MAKPLDFDHGGDDLPDVNGKDRPTDNTITEQITVPDRDLSPVEMARIMRQVSRVTNFLAGNIMRYMATSGLPRTVGAGAQITQAIINCAAQADMAAVQLEGPSSIAPYDGRAGMPPFRGGGRA
jgi:hypothetical protein